MDEMGKRIRDLRVAKGWTQTDLGDRVGLKASAIAKYENGHSTNMKQSVIKAMAEAFGVSPSYLMGLDEDGYYSDEETHEIAQMLLQRPELQMLFDASRDVSKEDIEAIVQLVERMKK